MNIYQYMQLAGFIPLAALFVFLCYKQWKELWESKNTSSNSYASPSEKQEGTQKESILYSNTRWNERAIMHQIVLTYLYVRAKENYTPSEAWSIACRCVNALPKNY